MTESLKLMCILAHPDDESMGTGGVLAKYASAGVATYLVTATRGERGWNGPEEDNPGLEALGKMREAELIEAASVLGLHEVSHLDYVDGDLDQADPRQAIAKITQFIRRVRPQVVVTFSPDGAYGHPDHIAISQFTQAAIVCAADAGYIDPQAAQPHRVSKFYYMVESESLVQAVRSIMGGISMEVDGVNRRHFGWPEWAITTRIDATAHWRTVVKAILCHRSQIPSLPGFNEWGDDLHKKIWGPGNFYRVFSLVNGGRRVEDDFFEGLR
ncbi:MAG: PIG-L deacetylase family protein [Chloroflexota bacterium]